MSDSTRRAIRAGYQLIIAITTGAIALSLALPPDLATEAVFAALVAWSATVTKVINALEDAGVIPSWLK